MAADYPTSAKSFTSLNEGDVIQDTHIEAAYDEITAIEQALLTGGLAHAVIPDATANNRDLGTDAKRWRDLHLERSVIVDGVSIAPVWDDYTPTLSAAGGGASLGDGTIVGRWQSLGKTVHFGILLTIGATTNLGSGGIVLSLPAAVAAGTLGFFGQAHAIDSGTGDVMGQAVMAQGQSSLSIYSTSDAAVWTPTSPFTWTTSDQLYVTGWYEKG